MLLPEYALQFQLAPFCVSGMFPYLPVPMFHDWEIGYTSKEVSAFKAVTSATKHLRFDCHVAPAILLFITSVISADENCIRKRLA